MSKEWLIEEYVNKRRHIRDISEEAGVHQDLIRFFMDQHKIYRPLPKCEHGMVVCQKCKKL
jgi:hypothetical protein